MKNILKNKGFWAVVVSVAIMAAQLFGVKIDAPYVAKTLNALCAAAAFLGIASFAKSSDESDSSPADFFNDSSSDETNTSSSDSPAGETNTSSSSSSSGETNTSSSSSSAGETNNTADGSSNEKDE